MKKFSSQHILILICVLVFISPMIHGAWVNNINVTPIVEGIEALVNEQKADYNTLRSRNRNVCLDFADLDISSTATAYETNNTIDYVIDNVMYQKASFTGAVSGTTLQNDKLCKFLITLDSSGSATATQSSIVASTETVALPAVPSDECPIGYVQVSTAGAVFTPGTTDLSAANVTDTYVELMNVNSGSSDTTAVSSSDANTDQ